MRIPRVFVDSRLRTGDTVTLSDNTARHVRQVLRLKPGARVVVFNGDGGEHEAVLEGSANGSRVRLTGYREPIVESSLNIVLGQGVCRGDRMDYALQKAVELGVARVSPVWTARTVVQLEGKRLHRRMDHWLGVLRAASEQCGRTRVPALGPAAALAQWLDAEPLPGRKLILSADAATGLRDLTPPGEEGLVLLAGPEGGFTDAEIAQARRAGFTPVRLGPRVLRTETAGAAALAAIQTLWGDLA